MSEAVTGAIKVYLLVGLTTLFAYGLELQQNFSSQLLKRLKSVNHVYTQVIETFFVLQNVRG